jgi:hypothetical protein
MDYALYQSEKGNYFIGETPRLSGQTTHALAALQNPHCSNHALYVNAITITNTFDESLAAEFYLRSRPIHGPSSNLISCTNTILCPEPIPEGEIIYIVHPDDPPKEGIPIFSRIISPKSTLVVDGGQIILGSGQSLNVYIGGFCPVVFDSVRFAFGWWENRTCPHTTSH